MYPDPQHCLFSNIYLKIHAVHIYSYYSDCVKLDVLYSKSREMLVINSGLSFGAQYLGVLSSVVV
jgi:hypothetical protein